MKDRKNYIEVLLQHLGYTQNNGEWAFTFEASQATITVDTKLEKILYPTDKGFVINEQQTCNFSAPENFVVLECVHQLLLKGYRPEHIELERRWSLGHSAKSGRADICVRSETGAETLFIIECKTYGAEYEKALKDLQSDGGQLFSYLQQDKSTRWLCLYASYLDGDEIKRSVTTIPSYDDEQILQLAQKDTNIATYQQAKTVEQSYHAWTKTYEKKSYEDLILSENTVAYNIGVQPLRKRDLKEFNPQDKIVNKFEEILRHNNVSDKENAFNKLLALFICKLVDEMQKDEDDIVDFQYKQGTDTYESLQDRLQRLHKEGMDKFMREEVFYVSNEYPQQLFERYKGGNRNHAIKDLQETFRKLKFYSNNDFAFKEVHNEELFLQNGKILVEMVRLFENYRIIYPGKHQFLGDLFEQLLNKGFKQNEGQFFTPTPITRFMWEALPIEQIIESENGELPKVIDYACGAGHFLTEGIESIARASKRSEKRDWVKDYIFGIEKDYRLARVSKIALFMNGAGEGNIIFGDGLENDKTRGIENGTFSILVANPPYSVKAFKSHLILKHNDLELLDRISNDGGEIEVLFVERIAQLLKPGGVAAVILPSSILSNNSGSYIGAREVLLKNFLIKAIVQFGSKTFAATGTNTVVLFLRKYMEPPKPGSIAEDSVTNIFNNEPSSEWPDQEILSAYLEHIAVDEALYVQFIKQEATLDELSKNEHMRLLVDVFNESSVYKILTGKKTFKNLSASEKDREIHRAFYQFAHDIEREKLFYFAMVKDQTTLIATAPTSNTEQKKFLGYDWSNRKGNEGIQISQYGGQLFDPKNSESKDHVASYIREDFVNQNSQIAESLNKVLRRVDTKNMLNFNSSSFAKSINLVAKSNWRNEVSTKYKLLRLGDVASVIRGVTYKKDQQVLVKSDNMILTADNISLSNQLDIKKIIYLNSAVTLDHSKKLVSDDIFMCFSSGSKAHLGKCCFISIDTEYYAGGFMGILRVVSDQISSKYLYYVLSAPIYRNMLSDLGTGGNIQNLSSVVGEIKIPVPPVDIQQQIISACEEIEQRYQETRMQIEEYKKQIQDIFEQLDVAKISGGGGYRLSDSRLFTLSIGKRVVSNELTSSGIPVYSANVFEPVGLIDKEILSDYDSDSIIWGIDGDWMVNTIAKGKAFYPTDHCGVLRCDENIVHPKYLARIIEQEGIQMRFSRSHRASLDRIREIKFNAPPIELQNSLMGQVENLQKEIEQLEATLPNMGAELSSVVKQYLQ